MNHSVIFFLLLSLLLLLLALSVVVHASESCGFSYNSFDDYNPQRWSLLVSTTSTDDDDDDSSTSSSNDNNQCDGNLQSPIPIPVPPVTSLLLANHHSFLGFGRKNNYQPQCTMIVPDDSVDEFYKPECLFNNNNSTSSQLEYAITDHNLEAKIIIINNNNDNNNQQQCSTWKDDDTNIVWMLTSLHVHLGWEHRPEQQQQHDIYYDDDDRTMKHVELHLVHSSGKDMSQVLVIAIRFEAITDAEGDDPILARLLLQWSNVKSDCDNDHDDDDNQEKQDGDSGGGDTVPYEQSISSDHRNDDNNSNNQLFSSSESFYKYRGSFTIPPCTQDNVTWFVLQRVRSSMSIQQFYTLERLIMNYRNDKCVLATVASEYNKTTRPLQPRNGRSVDLVCSQSTVVTLLQQQQQQQQHRQQQQQLFLFGLTIVITMSSLVGIGIFVLQRRGSRAVILHRIVWFLPEQESPPDQYYGVVT